MPIRTNVQHGVPRSLAIQVKMPDRRRLRAKNLEDLVTTDPGTLGHRALAYVADLELRNYSPHTIRTARIHARLFLTWCEEREITDPKSVTLSTLRSYQRYLFHYRKEDGRRLSFTSQFDRLAGVRRLFRWMHRHGELAENPAATLLLPRTTQRLPRTLTEEEAEAVLAQPDLETSQGVRDRAIVETLYSTGLRRGELQKLQIRDLDFPAGTLLVRKGKGKKERLIPLSERAAAWLEKYLEEVRPLYAKEPDDGWLFLGRFGRPLQENQLGKLTRTYVRGSGIGKEGSCHLFRHTMATLMLEGGADIRYIQKMLGHATLQSTEIYTHVAIRQLQKVHQETHPGAKLRREDSDPREALLSSLAAEADEDSP